MRFAYIRTYLPQEKCLKSRQLRLFDSGDSEFDGDNLLKKFEDWAAKAACTPEAHLGYLLGVLMCEESWRRVVAHFLCRYLTAYLYTLVNHSDRPTLNLMSMFNILQRAVTPASTVDRSRQCLS